jgi:eukaryotic-like serine/threonine-protein kinase
MDEIVIDSELLADRFVLEQLAGRGGMGEVYRALDRRTGQRVAIKIVCAHADAQIARFEREARLLAELDHPLIVRYIAHGTLHTGAPFLAMEWLDGHDLASRLSRERLGDSDGLALGLAAAEALAALHDRGIVHRDLKPSNIFLVDGRLDRSKLLDLGLARGGGAARMTWTGTVLGTIEYMAPEQARGGDELDARVDVFSLGCVLFECLTGERPFAAEHPTAVLMKLLFEEAPRLADRCPGIPAELDALVASMLSKHPEERPRDARAVARALAAIQAGRPASMRPTRRCSRGASPR